LTSLRNIPTSSTGLGGEIATLPSKPDLEPLSQEEFKPVASGELSVCLGCKFDGAGCACTFDVVIRSEFGFDLFSTLVLESLHCMDRTEMRYIGTSDTSSR
jgi:hypothetical protein